MSLNYSELNLATGHLHVVRPFRSNSTPPISDSSRCYCGLHGCHPILNWVTLHYMNLKLKSFYDMLSQSSILLG